MEAGARAAPLAQRARHRHGASPSCARPRRRRAARRRGLPARPARLEPYLDHLDACFCFELLHAPWEAGAVRAAIAAATADRRQAGVGAVQPRLPAPARPRRRAQRPRRRAAAAHAARAWRSSTRATSSAWPTGRTQRHDRAGRDRHRHPMPWDATPNAGFTHRRAVARRSSCRRTARRSEQADRARCSTCTARLIALRRELRRRARAARRRRRRRRVPPRRARRRAEPRRRASARRPSTGSRRSSRTPGATQDALPPPGGAQVSICHLRRAWWGRGGMARAFVIGAPDRRGNVARGVRWWLLGRAARRSTSGSSTSRRARSRTPPSSCSAASNGAATRSVLNALSNKPTSSASRSSGAWRRRTPRSTSPASTSSGPASSPTPGWIKPWPTDLAAAGQAGHAPGPAADRDLRGQALRGARQLQHAAALVPQGQGQAGRRKTWDES